MSATASASNVSGTQIEWMWQSNQDPWSKAETPQWSYYSYIENKMIEEAYSKGEKYAYLDGFHIDLKHLVQILETDEKCQRPVKRVELGAEVAPSRKERFMPDPIAPKLPYGGQYGWVSPFILEVRKSLGLQEKQLPSNDKRIVPKIVEKAARGIIKEGESIGKRRVAERMAKELMEQQNKGIKEVWKCCARLYSMEDFLYKKLNEAMRLIGSQEQEQQKIWRSKIDTLGPYCLLLWDNPFNNKLNGNIEVYRGAKLNDDQIATYQELAKSRHKYRSFQAFTSCSRNRRVAESFAENALFIMEIEYAFTVDICPYSTMPKEEEELITPGVCFTVTKMEFDKTKRRHLIYLNLQQRFSSEYKQGSFKQQFIIVETEG